MPNATYTPLATVTLASLTGTVTFSNIPATYRDLILVSVPVHDSNTGSGSCFARFNSDTGSNYPFVYMGSDGSVITGATTLTAVVTARFDNRRDGMGICHIMDYSATDKHKTTLTTAGMGNRTTAGIQTLTCASRWANTAAINSIVLFPEVSTNFASGSRFDLYGVIA